jgi:energy-coupling factor transport system permease protein
MIFQYQQDSSLFHRVDPISKFIWLTCISILTIYYEEAIIQMTLFIAILLIAIVMVNMPLTLLWKGLRIPFWFGFPYFVLQLIFVPGQTELIQLGGFIVTSEAFDFAIAITLRLLTLILASLLFIYSTDPRDLVLALAQKVKIPYRFAYGISIALRFLPILEAEAAIIRDAQRIRGIGAPKSLTDKLTWWKRFSLAVFISAVRRVEKTAIVMEVKGFGAHSDRTYRRTLLIPFTGILLSTSSVVVTVAVLFIY